MSNSADADAAPPHPWVEEPGRMVEDLRYLLGKVRDALPRLPADFDRVRYGGVVKRLLRVIRKALKDGDQQRLAELERLDPGADLRESLRDAQSLIESLQKQLDDRPPAQSTAMSSLAAVTEVESLQARLDEVAAANVRLTARNRELSDSLAEYSELATVDELRSYVSHGPAAEVGEKAPVARSHSHCDACGHDGPRPSRWVL
jgi:hypothetical protein